MKSIYKIINEELILFLSESYETNYEFFEAEDNIKNEIFYDFLNNNNQDFTKNILWQLIPYERLQHIWEYYIKTKSVRDIRGLDYIEKIVIRNILRINVITTLAGHTQWGDEEAMDDNIGYWVNEQINCIIPYEQQDTNQLEIPFDNPNAAYKQKEPDNNYQPCNTEIHPFAEQIIEENLGLDSIDREKARTILRNQMNERFFDYYLTDPKSGHMYISDYGLTPLMTLGLKLYDEDVSENKVILIDKILNVIHQRSDIAAWFIQGGSAALSKLSGYDIPDEDGWGNSKSVISGKYNMSDYYK